MDSQEVFRELLIIGLLVLANGLFAAAEIALVATKKQRAQRLVAERRWGARALLGLLESPERFLATVQIGITVLGATAAAYGGSSLARQLQPLLELAGLSPEHAAELALALLVAGISFASIVVGELVPKSLALKHAEAAALALAWPLDALSRLARPLVWLLTACSNAVLRPFGDRTSFVETHPAADELGEIVRAAVSAGSVEPDSGDLAVRALEFANLAARDVMLPRSRMQPLPLRGTRDDLFDRLVEQGQDRAPVCRESPVDIVGYVRARDLLAMLGNRALIVLEDVLQPAYFVPETMRSVVLLRELQRRQLRMAFVVDERGTLVGQVSLEDLLEELVGEILAEDQRREERMSREAPGVWLVRGDASMRDVGRALGLELGETGGPTTLGGLCVELAGEIPEPDTWLQGPEGLRLEIVDSSPRRVLAVRVHLPPARTC